MVRTRGLLSALALLALLGCHGTDAVAPDTRPAVQAENRGPQVQPQFVVGEGRYALPGQDVNFFVTAVSLPKGGAVGLFRHWADEGGGLTIDVTARVTCLSVDPLNHRAWIGGVVTRNASTDPSLQTPIHQPGQDVWFRVLDDDGTGVDRSTFTGFKGAAGFPTSADYCAGRPWAAGNARTWPVTGHVVVKP